MQYEFLKKFPRRMKNVGLYAVIIQNSSQKLSWKQYGFTKFDEQINLLFEVLLYIMEQSLKEEKCTMDDIATYIDTINVQYLRKDISYEREGVLQTGRAIDIDETGALIIDLGDGKCDRIQSGEISLKTWR